MGCHDFFFYDAFCAVSETRSTHVFALDIDADDVAIIMTQINQQPAGSRS